MKPAPPVIRKRMLAGTYSPSGSPALEGAIKDVVSQFWNDDKMTVADAQARIAAAAKTK